jgi:hypothetical protein
MRRCDGLGDPGENCAEVSRIRSSLSSRFGDPTIGERRLAATCRGPRKKLLLRPRDHSSHVYSNDGIENVYHRTCLSYFERRRTRMFILLVKNKLVLCPQTSRSRTTNCVRFRDFLVFTAWRQKDARNGWQVQQSKQLRMIAVG